MSTTTPTVPTIDTTSDAYADYVACDVNGETQSARADARGIKAATVSANVRRIRALIAAGASTDGDGTTSAPTVAVLPFDAWVGATYGDDAAFVARICADAIGDAMRSHDRARQAIERANALMAVADADIARCGTLFDGSTGEGVPPFSEVRSAYTDYADAAKAAVVEPDAEAQPEPDAEPDAEAQPEA